MSQELLKDLALAKVTFQLRAIQHFMEENPRVPKIECAVCGDMHDNDKIPYYCETGDGA